MAARRRRPAGARADRAAGVDGRHHADDRLHPVRRLRLVVPVDGGRPRLHRPGGAGQGLPLRRRPARRRDPRAPLRPRPGPARDLRLHALLLAASTPARRASRRWTRSCACAARPAADEEIHDRNNGHNHEDAFVKIIEKKGTLDESLLLQESYAPGVKGKLIPKPAAIKGLLGSIPTAIRGVRSGKMRSLPKLIPGVHPKLPGDAQEQVKRIYERAEESTRAAQPLHHRRGGRGAGARRGDASSPARSVDRGPEVRTTQYA